MKAIFAISISLLLSSFAKAQSAQQNAPLRMAKIHGTLSKLTATYSPMNTTQVKVCDLDGDVPVYQSASGDTLKNLPVCESTVNGEKVKIYLSNEIEIFQRRNSTEMVKAAVSVMNIITPTDSNIFQHAAAGTLDLNAKTILLGFGSQTFSNGQPVTEESFSADLSFDDVVQPTK